MSTNPKVGSTPKLIVVITENGSPKDISGADALYIFLMPPGDGVVSVKTAEFSTNGSDGAIEYKCNDRDLYPDGSWQIQGQAEIGDDVWPSDLGAFTVDPSLATIHRGGGQASGFSTVTGTGAIAA